MVIYSYFILMLITTTTLLIFYAILAYVVNLLIEKNNRDQFNKFYKEKYKNLW